MNIIIITGNLGQDAEKMTTQSGVTYIRFSVATNEVWKDKNTNQKKSHTTWHNCMLYGNYDNLAQYLVKGTNVTVTGLQRNDLIEYKKNGQPVTLDGKAIKTTMSFIKVDKVELNGSASGNRQNSNQEPSSTTGSAAAYSQGSNSDDLPF